MENINYLIATSILNEILGDISNGNNYFFVEGFYVPEDFLFILILTSTIKKQLEEG